MLTESPRPILAAKTAPPFFKAICSFSNSPATSRVRENLPSCPDAYQPQQPAQDFSELQTAPRFSIGSLPMRLPCVWGVVVQLRDVGSLRRIHDLTTSMMQLSLFPTCSFPYSGLTCMEAKIVLSPTNAPFGKTFLIADLKLFFYSHTMAVSRMRYVEGRRSEICTSLIIWIIRILAGLQVYVFMNLLFLGSHSLSVPSFSFSSNKLVI